MEAGLRRWRGQVRDAVAWGWRVALWKRALMEEEARREVREARERLAERELQERLEELGRRREIRIWRNGNERQEAKLWISMASLALGGPGSGTGGSHAVAM